MSKTLHRSLEAKLAALDGELLALFSLGRISSTSCVGCSFFLILIGSVISFFFRSFLNPPFSDLYLPIHPGPEWDSSDDEENVKVISQDVGKKGRKAKKQKGDADGQQQESKAKKSKAEKVAAKATKPSSVIYLGHLPQGFEEAEIRGFLNQFGSIRKLRLSRSKKTGSSRGYAFVQFVDSEVAAIVADTMSGYFLMEKRLVCHIMPRDKCHSELFAGHDRKFVKIDWQGLNREQVNKTRTAEGMKKITARLVKREIEKRKKLEALGIDYDFPGYAAGAKQEENTGGKRKRKASKDEGAGEDDEENVQKTPKRRERKGSEVSTDGEGSIKAKSAKKKSSKKKRKTSDAEELEAVAEEEEIKTKTPKKSTTRRSAKTEVKKDKKKSSKKKRRDSVP